MGKKTPLENDLARLKQKVRSHIAATDSSEGDPKIRALHKRLKRAQRKRRSEATRKRHAMGKAGAAQKAEGAGA